MDRSAVILASGFSEQFKEVKALLPFNGKPLLKHVVDSLKAIVDEIIIVAENEKEAQDYQKIVEAAKIIVARSQLLTAAKTGFEVVHGTHTLLTSTDSPLITPNVVDLFFELCQGKTAAVPRWPDQRIEPLHSVFHTKSVLKATQMAIEENCEDLAAIIDNLGGVRYISTLALEEFDPELKTFFNIKTPIDLKIAETLTKTKPWLIRKQRKKQ
jgi:molybdenum cofactor guanylyltransferase